MATDEYNCPPLQSAIQATEGASLSSLSALNELTNYDTPRRVLHAPLPSKTQACS